MALSELLTQLEENTALSLALFRPELIVCATILLLLTARIFPGTKQIPSLLLALVGAAAAFLISAKELLEGLTGYGVEVGASEAAAELVRQEIFSGLLVYDGMTVFFRCLLAGFALVFLLLTWISGIPDRDDGADIYSLILGATLGMMLMASANHLLMVFLAVEMASVPSYVLAGVLKGRRQSSEAALKYSVYGAGTAGIMLYGISLLCGVLGSGHFPTMAAALGQLDAEGAFQSLAGGEVRILALAALMVMVGVAFKLSAVPFHFWCPDVFEGAPAEVNAFLSVASKAAAVALLVRVALGFGTLAEDQPLVTQAADTAVVTTAHHAPPQPQVEPPAKRSPRGVQAQSVSHPTANMVQPVAATADGAGTLSNVRTYLAGLIGLLAAITCTFGNLAAFGQTNIKRLLAYSTIAHAGYMMMPVTAALVVAGTNDQAAREAINYIALYVLLYLFMNLGAFAIVAFLRNAMRSEEIADYAGLIHRCPVVVVSFCVILISLIGLPPMAGFVGKLWIFASLAQAGSGLTYTLLVIGGLNTAISLVYYLRVMRVMTIEPEPESRGPVSLGFFENAYTVAMAVPVFLLGIFWNRAYELASIAGKQFFS